MKPAAATLRAHAERIASATTEQHFVEELLPSVCALVERIADRLEQGAMLEADVLPDTGPDPFLLAKILRSILFDAIEALRNVLDPGEFSETVLALRACIRSAIPYPAVDAEDQEFYRRLMRSDDEGLAADHGRLLRLFQELALTFHDIVYVHDMNGTLLYVNRPGLNLMRFTMQDVLDGLSVYDFIVPEYVELIESRLESPGAVSRAPYDSEVYTKDGERVPFEITTRVLRKGRQVVGVIGLARDLRLARRLESEIRRSNAYIDTVLTAAPLGIVLLDSQCMVLDANPAAVRLLGAPGANALIGNPLYGLFEDPGITFRDLLVQALREGVEAHGSYARTTAFGLPFHGELKVIPLDREPGCMDSLLVLLTDLSGSSALQEQLIQAGRLNAIGDIVGGVAHELNNPLTGILGYTQLLLNAKMDPGAKARLEHVVSEVERCRTIVQNLVSFARHDRTEVRLLDVNEIIGETLTLREYQIRVDGIRLEVDLAPDPLQVRADPHDLQRVFLNIINNAQQALATVEGREKELAITSCKKGNRVHIRFADNGPGVPESIRARVFDPFFTTRDVGEGTGLGLSVCYGIVKSHGGDIVLESHEGRGAAFTVVLPLSEPA